MSNEIEIWKDVVGYEGLYEVSNLGQVRSIRRDIGAGRKGGGLIKGYITKVGYRYVGIGVRGVSKRGCSVHRMVCKAFHPNPLNKETVNHIDGDKSNNRASNLEWSTWTENNRHARRTGLNIAARGERSGNSKLTEADVIRIRWLSDNGMKNKDIAIIYGLSRRGVSFIVSRINWKHVK
jgi:DNA-binding CsgD family transcriptional regulator